MDKERYHDLRLWDLQEMYIYILEKHEDNHIRQALSQDWP